jgi:hypothetical protein
MGKHGYKYTWRGRVIQAMGYLISWLSSVQAKLIMADSLSKRE